MLIRQVLRLSTTTTTIVPTTTIVATTTMVPTTTIVQTTTTNMLTITSKITTNVTTNNGFKNCVNLILYVVIYLITTFNLFY